VGNPTQIAKAGTTRTFITPLAGADDDIYVGTPVKIGNYWVTITEFYRAQSGAGYGQTGTQPGLGYLLHTPLPADVAISSAVKISEYSHLEKLIVSSASGQNAVYCEGPVASPNLGRQNAIDHCDLSKMRWSGKTALNLFNTSVNIFGDLPLTVGRHNLTSTNFTVQGDYLSHVICHGSTILANPRVDYHFGFGISGTGEGSALLLKCPIEDRTKLVNGFNNQINQLQMIHCVSAIDSTHVWHPVKAGLIPVSTGSGTVSGGQYHYRDDGVLECWLNVDAGGTGISTNATGDLTWTFPAAFNSATTVMVTANSADTTTAYNVSCAAATTTTVAIKTRTLAGAGAAAVVKINAIGRWTP
jgi:hypothetical protein